MANKRTELTRQQEVQNEPRLTPRVEIHETEDAVVVRADMPGVAKDTLSVSVEGDQLTIRGRKAPLTMDNATVLQRETRDGVYERAFTIGESVDRGKVTAQMEQGILTVTLAKAEHARPRKVEVAFE